MFHGWENFYMMAGTAAATFAGLLFVVLTLGSNLSATPAAGGAHGFVTPVLVHFGGVLFLSLILLAPWPSMWPIAAILALQGLVGIAYAGFVVRLVRKLDFVALDARDWIAYAVAPALANASLLAGAAGLPADNTFAPYAIAGAVMLFLFVGIVDAWDMTLWIVGNQAMAGRAAPTDVSSAGAETPAARRAADLTRNPG